jgi:leucyl-tRNA synthetase
MSKTAGNVIDPLDMMDRYGTDALRFSLLTGSTPGNDMSLSEERIVANRNFANKIWNATRFVVSNLGAAFDAGYGTWNLSAMALPDRWIISRLNRLIECDATDGQPSVARPGVTSSCGANMPTGILRLPRFAPDRRARPGDRAARFWSTCG